MIKLGHSMGAPNLNYNYLELLEWVLSVGDQAIELWINPGKTFHLFTDEELAIIKKFDYISLHAPVGYFDQKGEKRFYRYPSQATNSFIESIKELDEKIHLDTILFHPDLISDFTWINKEFGQSLAFENMDKDKKFARTVEDMAWVFEQSPQARWVCDVNHIFTNNPDMKSTVDFHHAFADKLCHYHISAFNGFHDVFHTNQQELGILKGVLNISKPMIHEGGTIKSDQRFLQIEDTFVRQYFS